MNKQDSQPCFPEALLSPKSTASKKKEKNNGQGVEGEEKQLCSRRTNAPGPWGPLQGAAGRGGPSCPPLTPSPGAWSGPSSLTSSGLGSSRLSVILGAHSQAPKPRTITRDLLCAGPGEMQNTRSSGCKQHRAVLRQPCPCRVGVGGERDGSGVGTGPLLFSCTPWCVPLALGGGLSALAQPTPT